MGHFIWLLIWPTFIFINLSTMVKNTIYRRRASLNALLLFIFHSSAKNKKQKIICILLSGYRFSKKCSTYSLLVIWVNTCTPTPILSPNVTVEVPFLILRVLMVLLLVGPCGLSMWPYIDMEVCVKIADQTICLSYALYWYFFSYIFVI